MKSSHYNNLRPGNKKRKFLEVSSTRHGRRGAERPRTAYATRQAEKRFLVVPNRDRSTVFPAIAQSITRRRFRENAYRIFSTADLISISRIVLIPLLWIAEVFSQRYVSLFLFSAMILSDLLDGVVARMYYETDPRGSIVDLVADFIVVIFIFAYLFASGEMSLYPLVTAIVSCSAYSLCSRVKTRIVYGRIGKFSGTICYAGIASYFAARLISMDAATIVALYIGIFIPCFLAVGLIETVMQAMKLQK
jgi:phosphatidylglycerophosphate synthase